ncbi:hypothetical protein TEQG_03678 [Trichophyton equinum CBS 127.97]|uniref:Uncharacterized protein n=1 Tax=Trichophyton equinum (strain ATCC MYA-4606 / CBS 127.97) TaxID=559882 RepID=F2PRG1_TRIEC|nr:hypothetical protein TEQG_03678 [Trichophyton equinum CBS 127.97]
MIVNKLAGAEASQSAAKKPDATSCCYPRPDNLATSRENWKENTEQVYKSQAGAVSLARPSGTLGRLLVFYMHIPHRSQPHSARRLVLGLYRRPVPRNQYGQASLESMFS